MREVTGADFPIRTVGRRPGDPAICVAAGDKARSRLGWKPEHSELATIVGDAWRFHRARG